MRVMAIGAHPDDIELHCAGTLARFAQLGHELIMCVCCDGSGGHMKIPPEELSKIREEEARKAAALLGAQFIWLGIPDMFIMDNKETRISLTEALRQGRPDLIITHDPEDYHTDHRLTSQLVFAASFTMGLPNIKTEHPAHLVVPPLYYMDNPAGMRFSPQEYVDITETFAIKRQMLCCHESQLVWLKEHDHIDIVEFMEAQDRARGIQCGVMYAEGFRHAEIWPRTLPQRLLP